MTPMRPELNSLLSDLRGRIRRYVLMEGTTLVLAVLGVLFWLSLGVDHLWFQMSSLELPVWFRAMFDLAAVGLVAALFVVWVVLRSVIGFRAHGLALVLEKRFPELNDRLITAVEFAETHSSQQSELSEAMLTRTIDDVVTATQKIDVTAVFNRGPMRKAMTSAAVLLVSIVTLGVMNQEALATWRDSFLSLSPEYWNRESDLTIHVIAQPGDLVRDFKDASYKHARGSDLTILVKTKDGSKVPDRVQLAYRMETGGRGTVLFSKLDREFRHTITAVLEDLEFRVYGGDFVTRQPYRIHVVDPPRLEQINLACNYPSYTGKQKKPKDGKPTRDIVSVRGTQVALPAETEFLLQAQCNKSLASTRIQFGNFEMVVDRTAEGISGQIMERTEDGELVGNSELDSGRIKQWISSDGKLLTIPFVLSSQESEVAKDRIEEITTPFGYPFVIAPDTQVRIFLEDTDEILTSEPARLLINGLPDTPPQVETKLRGIGTSITRKASIPIIGRIMDDYGISDLKFEFQVNDGDWKYLPLEKPPEKIDSDGIPIREFVLQRSSEEEYERFNVVPLDLSLSQKLTVCVVATDGDDLNGPHQTRGERYSFKIVSNEELLSVLYQRELNLRRQFEQILTEARRTQTDLILHRSKADERRKALARDEIDEETRAKIADISTAIVACAERSLHQVRKNANETASIELGFRDIREELVNNGLHTPQTLERIDDQIVKPLHSIGTDDYPAVDQAIGLFRLANERRQDPISAIDVSTEAIDVLIRHMEKVLLEMRKLETFQEALEQLKAIIEHQETLRKKAETEGKRELLKKLGGDLVE